MRKRKRAQKEDPVMRDVRRGKKVIVASTDDEQQLTLDWPTRSPATRSRRSRS